MKPIGANLCLALSLILLPISAGAQADESGAAEIKSATLEQKIAATDDAGAISAAEVISKVEAQDADASGAQPMDDAFTCLARTIYWETRNEDDTSMRAIASVVINRLGHDGFPNTVCEVVKQENNQGRCEFSWWCDGHSDDVEEQEPYMRAKDIARYALNGELADNTDGALYFHHRGVDPYWADDYTKLTEVGGHIFYKPANGKAR